MRSARSSNLSSPADTPSILRILGRAFSGEAMGGHPYWYFVPYETDPSAALQKLRRREFEAGRYNPAIPFPKFPVDLGATSAGAKHRSIKAALEDSDADGTRSTSNASASALGHKSPCSSTPERSSVTSAPMNPTWSDRRV
jgi:hypothetical protein